MKSLLLVCTLAAIFAGSLIAQHATLAPLPPDGFDRLVAGDIVLKNCNKLQTGVLLKKLSEHGIPTE